MTGARNVAVIDIGKTNAKVALVDLATLCEVAVRTMPNEVLPGLPYPHFDCDRLREFILDTIAGFNREAEVDAISVTTHGCAAALLDGDGALALPVLDYEFAGPDALDADYRQARPPFSETGTPRLPLGLNLGAQLFWQERNFPAEFAKVRAILTWPQYWAFRLSGILASEATSLGCHSDLWNPHHATFSSLVSEQGWARKFPPVRGPGEALGHVLPELAARLGLKSDVSVHCGIHDSNASLYPHLLRHSEPFSVVSTGTWVVVMAIGGRIEGLDPARDCLLNVNALGDPVSSARFMGGREFETVTGGQAVQWSEADIASVLDKGVMLLPSIQYGSGPFPKRQGGWVGPKSQGPEPYGPERVVAASFYLALMTATCLELADAAGDIVVEGPFAANTLYLSMLSQAAGRPVVTARSGNATGTSIGAALLAGSPPSSEGTSEIVTVRDSPAYARYAELWRARVLAEGSGRGS